MNYNINIINSNINNTVCPIIIGSPIFLVYLFIYWNQMNHTSNINDELQNTLYIVKFNYSKVIVSDLFNKNKKSAVQ